MVAPAENVPRSETAACAAKHMDVEALDGYARTDKRYSSGHDHLPPAREPDEWTIHELAARIGMPEPTPYTWVQQGRLRSRRISCGPRRYKLARRLHPAGPRALRPGGCA